MARGGHLASDDPGFWDDSCWGPALPPQQREIVYGEYVPVTVTIFGRIAPESLYGPCALCEGMGV